MARIHSPLTSFGAELQAVLRQGADRKIRIKFPSRNLAIRFKQRLNALRNAMKHAKHPDWEQLYRCGVYDDSSDPADPCVVEIGPKDSEFREALLAAHIDVDAPPQISEVEIAPPSPGTIDSFLSDLTDATNVQKVLSENADEEPDVNSL